MNPKKFKTSNLQTTSNPKINTYVHPGTIFFTSIIKNFYPVETNKEVLLRWTYDDMVQNKVRISSYFLIINSFKKEFIDSQNPGFDLLIVPVLTYPPNGLYKQFTIKNLDSNFPIYESDFSNNNSFYIDLSFINTFQNNYLFEDGQYPDYAIGTLSKDFMKSLINDLCSTFGH